MRNTKCRWCNRDLARQVDHDSLPENEDGGLCWREWNDAADCYQIEDRLIAAAPDLLEALEAQEDAENWIAENDESNPFYQQTYVNLLNAAAILRKSAIAKAKGGEA